MLCPKCQRPLEDDADGPYVCCAGATLQWRCRECAKVSEGFAFPYGRCPHCGGTLEVSEAQTLQDATALAGIRTAFEIELGGRAFYARAAGSTADPQMKALFERFSAMESEHMATLTRRYHIDAPSPAPGFEVKLAAIFGGVESRPEDPGNLFRVAIAMEQRAAEYFAQQAAHVAGNAAEAQLYRELAAEEREHAALLTTEFARWSAGKPGLLGDHGAD